MRESQSTYKNRFTSRFQFAGTQRIAAILTGDSMVERSHPEASRPMCLSLSIAGGVYGCGVNGVVPVALGWGSRAFMVTRSESVLLAIGLWFLMTRSTFHIIL